MQSKSVGPATGLENSRCRLLSRHAHTGGLGGGGPCRCLGCGGCVAPWVHPSAFQGKRSTEVPLVQTPTGSCVLWRRFAVRLWIEERGRGGTACTSWFVRRARSRLRRMFSVWWLLAGFSFTRACACVCVVDDRSRNEGHGVVCAANDCLCFARAFPTFAGQSLASAFFPAADHGPLVACRRDLLPAVAAGTAAAWPLGVGGCGAGPRIRQGGGCGCCCCCGCCCSSSSSCRY